MSSLLNLKVVVGIDDRVEDDPRFDWDEFPNEYEYVPLGMLEDILEDSHLLYDFRRQEILYLHDVIHVGAEEDNYNIVGITIEAGESGAQFFYGLAVCFPEIFGKSGYRVWPDFGAFTFPGFVTNKWKAAARKLLPLAGWTIRPSQLKVMLVWDWI